MRCSREPPGVGSDPVEEMVVGSGNGRGIVSKTIDPKAKPDKQQKNLEKAVAKLLQNYPPQQKKQQ
jgi:hypothetical protein